MTAMPLDVYDYIVGDIFLFLVAVVVWKYMLYHSYPPLYRLLPPQKSNSSRKFEFSIINFRRAGLTKASYSPALTRWDSMI